MRGNTDAFGEPLRTCQKGRPDERNRPHTTHRGRHQPRGLTPGGRSCDRYAGAVAVFLRKLLRIGKLPDEIRAEVEREGVRYLAEFVPVTYRFTGSVPGKTAHGEIRSYVGALVITSQRVLGTLSSVPKLAGRAIDQRWSAPQEGAATADFSAEGLQINVSIGRVDPRFTGQLSLQYKCTIPEDVLFALPTRSLVFDVSREYVTRALGVQFAN